MIGPGSGRDRRKAPPGRARKASLARQTEAALPPTERRDPPQIGLPDLDESPDAASDRVTVVGPRRFPHRRGPCPGHECARRSTLMSSATGSAPSSAASLWAGSPPERQLFPAARIVSTGLTDRRRLCQSRRQGGAPGAQPRRTGTDPDFFWPQILRGAPRAGAEPPLRPGPGAVPGHAPASPGGKLGPAPACALFAQEGAAPASPARSHLLALSP
ncbi:hypothetical protein SAMN05421539_10927 [Jannaschia seohaensis]|uniref:Uncharacterized protein n=1 Tax=Jannaschia seohaensis TaxID=475081 RepID=A0A2Y9B0X5_9RHOB|nr:hypothetical protein BCF38_10927 [Jannaschia seohaensis]SSA49128.1 hypothetical protein SAMN05421539_10927 [Jannaschia seohaensis]